MSRIAVLPILKVESAIKKLSVVMVSEIVQPMIGFSIVKYARNPISTNAGHIEASAIGAVVL